MDRESSTPRRGRADSGGQSPGACPGDPRSERRPGPRPCRLLLPASRLLRHLSLRHTDSPRLEPASPHGRGSPAFVRFAFASRWEKSSLSPQRETCRGKGLSTPSPGGGGRFSQPGRVPWDSRALEIGSPWLLPLRQARGPPKQGQRRGSSGKPEWESAEPPTPEAVREATCQAHQPPRVPLSRRLKVLGPPRETVAVCRSPDFKRPLLAEGGVTLGPGRPSGFPGTRTDAQTPGGDVWPARGPRRTRP